MQIQITIMICRSRDQCINLTRTLASFATVHPLSCPQTSGRAHFYLTNIAIVSLGVVHLWLGMQKLLFSIVVFTWNGMSKNQPVSKFFLVFPLFYCSWS